MLDYVIKYVKSRYDDGDFDEYNITEDKGYNAIVVDIGWKRPPLRRRIHISNYMLESLPPNLIKTYLDKLFDCE